MSRTEEIEKLRAKMFDVRLKMQLFIRDEERYQNLKQDLKNIKKELAHLKYLELSEEKKRGR